MHQLIKRGSRVRTRRDSRRITTHPFQNTETWLGGNLPALLAGLDSSLETQLYVVTMTQSFWFFYNSLFLLNSYQQFCCIKEIELINTPHPKTHNTLKREDAFFSFSYLGLFFMITMSLWDSTSKFLKRKMTIWFDVSLIKKAEQVTGHQISLFLASVQLDGQKLHQAFSLVPFASVLIDGGKR